MTGSTPPPENTESWGSLREETVYEEGKRVMEAQKSDIDDLDDKALRTVRISSVLLAVGATGIEVIGIDQINNDLAIGSVGFFLLTLVFGVMVYNESDEVIGPTAGYLQMMRENSMSEDWDEDFLYQIEYWIEDNQETVEFNGYLLIICQIFFISAVATGVSSLLGLSKIETVVGAVVLVIIVGLTFLILKVRIESD